MTLKHFRAALTAAIVSLATTQAALALTIAQVAGPSGLNLQWDVMLLSFVICTVSGAAALLQRINAELTANPAHELPNPLLFCVTHMVGSWAAGLLAYVLGQQMHLEIWGSLALMIAGSYGGAKWLESKIESAVPKPPAPDEPQQGAPS